MGCRPRLRTRTSLLRGVPHTLLLLIASGVRADNDDDSNYQSNPLRNMHYGGLEGLEVGACGANEAGRCYRSEILVAFSQKHNLASVLLISSENTSLPQRFRDLCTSLRDLWYAIIPFGGFRRKVTLLYSDRLRGVAATISSS